VDTRDVALGTVSIREVAERLGIGKNLAYELARTGRLPVPVIRLGARRMVVAAAALDTLLSSPPPSSPQARPGPESVVPPDAAPPGDCGAA
jgi:excisionase family DNA binding protein